MTNTPNAPWLKHFGDIPEHLDYPQGSMFEAVKESAVTKKKMNSVAYEFKGKKTNYKTFFNKIETLIESIGLPKDKFYTHCFDGSSCCKKMKK